MINVFMLVGTYNGMLGLTQERFDELFPSLLKETLKNQTDINKGKKLPFCGMYYILKSTEGYDATAYSFLELSFPFFESSDKEIESWLKNANLDRINAMLAQCGNAPQDTPLRARVAYSSLLEATAFPKDVDKKTFAGHPELFNKSLLEQKKIDLNKHNGLIAESLVVRYCCKNNCK